MRTRTAVVAAVLLALAGCARDAPAPPEVAPPAVPDADRAALVAGQNAFACDLFRELAAADKGNVVCSPYSVAAALTMTSAGARGETAAQMAKVLGTAGLGDRVHAAEADLSYRLRHSDGKESGPELLIANALWGQRGLDFEPDFLRVTRDHYRAGLREVDYINDTEAARKTINAWVAGQTRDKIPELLEVGMLTRGTKLVLTNAIYFKGLWEHPFKAEQTVDDKFQTAPGQTIPVRMMKLRKSLRCLETDTFKAARLPYRGGKQSMVVVVPNAFDGLAAVEKAITADQVQGWLTRLSNAEVKLDLPKFNARSKFMLGDTLKKLGMPLPFEEGADFSGMSDKLRLEIKEVIHEAVVEVDEKGTVAAAATAVIVAHPVSAPVKPKVVTIRADRPFAFLIVDDASGAILFAGRVAKP